MILDSSSCMQSLMFVTVVVEKVSLWPALLIGELDDQLLLGIFFQAHGRIPVDESEMRSDEKSVHHLDNFKSYIRSSVQGALNGLSDRSERQDKMDLDRRSKKVHSEFRSMSKPADQGTVREIAERSGLSIKQVRKMKAENRLHELSDPP